MPISHRSLSRAAVLGCAFAVTAVPTAGARALSPQQTVFLDAQITHAATAGPDADHVGHRQLASGVLRDSAGRRIGRFTYTCTWTRVLAGGDALERCSASGLTADGTIRLSGPARESSPTHTWRVAGGAGRYRGARGTVLVRDVGDSESVLALRVTPRSASRLRVGVVRRPAANVNFISRADRICARASSRLAALPPFPFEDFDPLHPDPAVLPQVGGFFTGPGDPRGIFESAETRLRALGRPPAEGATWRHFLHARADELTIIRRQDKAALAADVPGFVRTVRANARTYRKVAIAGTVFGADRCVF